MLINLTPKQIKRELDVELIKGAIVITDYINDDPQTPIPLDKEQATKLRDELTKYIEEMK